MADEKKITRNERNCMADCIRNFWGADSRDRDSASRDKDYEQCLTDCRVCG